VSDWRAGAAGLPDAPRDNTGPLSATAFAELLEVARRFVREQLLPVEPRFLSRPFRELLPELHGLRAQARALGLWAPFLPESHGGRGLPLEPFAELSAVLGQSPIGHYVCNCQAPDVGNMELLLAHGSASQQAEWLAPLTQGTIRSCFAMTEPDRAGSNPTWLETRAVREGDRYRVSGHKWFTTGADGAAFAIVMAVTDPEAPPHARATQLIVPMDAPGVELVRNISVMGDPGSDHGSHAELRFHDVMIPVSNRLGAEGSGFALAQERLGPGRIHHCMRWIGICDRAFDLMCRRAVSRELSPGEPLANQQAVQHLIADTRAELVAARLMVRAAAARVATHGTRDAREAVSLIKFFVAGVLQRTLDRSIQLHGALGLTDDLPLAWWWRHERGARIYDGADEVHKSVVARELLRAYRAPTE
jgi:acyl-CoA dehydrogenase